MGRIMLATSASTDEEYGGTYVADAYDVSYGSSNVGDALDEVKSGATIKFNLNTTSPSKTVSFKGESCLIFIYRASMTLMALVTIDFWSTTPQVIAGTMPSNVTIAKSALSNQMTITSTYLFSFAITFIVI